jgi:hypothetical protein
MKAFLLLVLFIPSAVWGQTANPDIKKLEIPSAPGFVLLGIQPTNIQRPSTPRDFAAGIQSAIVNGSLQPNFAVEVNPLNWFNKPDPAKSKKLFYADDYFSNNPWTAIKRNFALSIGTSTSDTMVFGSLQKGLGLGYGCRVTLIPGKVNNATSTRYFAVEEADLQTIFLLSYKDQVNGIRANDSSKYIISLAATAAYDRAMEALSTNSQFLSADKQNLTSRIDAFRRTYSQLTVKEAKELKIDDSVAKIDRIKTSKLDAINKTKVPYAREGFILELALAGANVIQHNSWDSVVFAKSGIWLIPSYRWSLASEKDPSLIQSIDAMAIVRYLWNYKSVDVANYIDLGAKIQFNRNEWTVSIEAVGRYATVIPEGLKDNWTYSYMANFTYTIQENVTLRLTFGSSFDGNTTVYTKPNQVLAIGGINFGFLK